MVDLTQFLPRMPVPYPTAFNTGPASIDGPYTPAPVAPGAPVAPAARGFVAPARPITPTPVPYAANPLLANPAGGLPQRPPPMNDPQALIAQQVEPGPRAPDVLTALGAGASTVPVAQAPVSAVGAAQGAPVVPAAMLSPQPTPGAPGMVAPAPAAPAAHPNGIDVLRGSHMSYGEGTGRGVMTPRDAQIISQGFQPRIAPADIARYKLMDIASSRLQTTQQQLYKSYHDLRTQGLSDEEARKKVEPMNTEAQNQYAETYKAIANSQFGYLSDVNNMNKGMPALDGL